MFEQISVLFLLVLERTYSLTFKLLYIGVSNFDGSFDPDPHQNVMDPQHWSTQQ
jgi:hypothetical protein